MHEAGKAITVKPRVVVRGAGTQSVTVPAGTYQATLITEKMDEAVMGVTVRLDIQTWVANGVGPVKSEVISRTGRHDHDRQRAGTQVLHQGLRAGRAGCAAVAAASADAAGGHIPLTRQHDSGCWARSRAEASRLMTLRGGRITLWRLRSSPGWNWPGMLHAEVVAAAAGGDRARAALLGGAAGPGFRGPRLRHRAVHRSRLGPPAAGLPASRDRQPGDEPDQPRTGRAAPGRLPRLPNPVPAHRRAAQRRPAPHHRGGARRLGARAARLRPAAGHQPAGLAGHARAAAGRVHRRRGVP